MPAPTAELARRNGVELVRTGKFQTLTGSWNPTPADIKAAVEAMACPAIRKPVIRIGHTDQRFVGDGEPALGWFENLRAADGGNTLVADQVTLPWLHSVQAAAYPSRSIEGNYNHLCSEGHRHPFVIHTVALLGVTPPGVQTLRSLNDLPGLLGVAASGEVPDGARHVQVTVMAAGPTPDGDGDEDDEPTGAMVALIPTAEDAARLAVDGGSPPQQLHLTLAYLGDAADLDASARQDLIDAVSTAVNGLPIVDGEVFSAAVYNPGDTSDRDTCLVYQVSGDLLAAVQDALDDALDGIDQSQEPFFAHITAIYTDDLARLADLTANMGPVSFDRIRIAVAGQTVDIPLIDGPASAPAMPDDDVYAASAPGGDAAKLKSYWLAGPGLKRWAADPHPWTKLYHLLLRYIKDPDEAKRTASQWYIEHFGHTPNQQGVKAAGEFDEHKHPRDHDGKFAHEAGSKIEHAVGKADGKSSGGPGRKARIRPIDGAPLTIESSDGQTSLQFPYDGDDSEDHHGDDSGHEGDTPAPTPGHFDTIQLDKTTTADFADELQTIAETREQYLKKAQAASDALAKAEAQDGPGSAAYKEAQDAWFKLGGDGQRIIGGELDGKAGTLVYELRMGEEVKDTNFLIAIKPPDAGADWDLQEAVSDHAGAIFSQAQFKKLQKEVDASATVAASAPAPDLPAAEPEQPITEPKEDLVSDLSEFRSRLGLSDDADEQAMLAALDALKTKAETPEPTPEMVAASAAVAEKAKEAEAEKDELRKEVTVLASQVQSMSTKLAAAEQDRAATVKASVLDEAARLGKFTPADRPQWETDYDEAPNAITRVLASIAPGTAVPVMASGSAGPAEPASSDISEDELSRMFFGPNFKTEQEV